jgi:predicted dehydrogenase
MIVHHPQWQEARRLYREGAIGQPLFVDAAFSYDNRSDTDNIRNRAETGGGSVPDIGVYTLGAMRFLAGSEPVEVTAREVWLENGVDTFAHMTAQFGAPEVLFRSVTSMRLPARQEVVAQGTEGMLRLTAPFNAGVYDIAQLTLETGMERRTWRWPGVNQYLCQVEAFCRSLREGVDYACPLEFSRGTQEMIDRFWASHQQQTGV